MKPFHGLEISVLAAVCNRLNKVPIIETLQERKTRKIPKWISLCHRVPLYRSLIHSMLPKVCAKMAYLLIASLFDVEQTWIERVVCV